MRAACRIDRGARWSVGAFINAVEDPVAVGVARAAALVDGGSHRSIGTGVALVADPVVIRVRGWRCIWLEEGEPSRAHEMRRRFLAEQAVGLRGAGGRGRVDAPRLEARGEARAKKESGTAAAVKSTIGDPVRAGATEIEPRVASQDIERHPTRVEGVENQAAAADPGLDLRGPGGGFRRLGH